MINDPHTSPKLAKNKTVESETPKAVVTSKTEENSEKEAKKEEINGEQEAESGSANYNSSCKFNFLFYFIYKMKYDEKGELGSSNLIFEF